MRRTASAAFLVILTGCGGPREQPAFPQTDPASIREVARLYQGLVRIRTVTAQVCHRGLHPSKWATPEEAVRSVKIAAAGIGATGVAQVRVAPIRDVLQCPGTGGLRATATAFRDAGG